MAEDTGLRPPAPVGGGGGQDGGGAYTQMQRPGGGGGEDEQPPRERQPRSDGPEVQMAPGLREELPEAALLAFDRLNARLKPLQNERDALREKSEHLRRAAETIASLGAAGEYGVRTALESIVANRGSLSATPGFLLVAVSGLDAVAFEAGLDAWRRAAVHALGVVRGVSHAADTVGMLGGGLIAAVTVLGNREALTRRGREAAARFAAEPFHDGGRIWPLAASFGAAEIHKGAGVDEVIAAAERVRLESGGGAAVLGESVKNTQTASAPSAASAAGLLSDEDLDRLAITGVVAPPRAIIPAPPRAGVSAPPDEGSGDDVGQ